MSYFQKQKDSIKRVCESKTKDSQIAYLIDELADTRTTSKITRDDWKIWLKLKLFQIILAFLLGVGWGITFFT